MSIRTNTGSRINDYSFAGLANEASTKVPQLDNAVYSYKYTRLIDNYLGTNIINIQREKS